MKKVLITGAGSYIGTALEHYLSRWPEQYQVDKISLRGDCWQEAVLEDYNVVVHAAGIAHRKETADNAAQYYQVNRDLTVEFAQRAKAAGVSQFVFLSSMSVYGMDTGVIMPQTAPRPKSHYGKSKLEAERALQNMEDETFAVSILRPPMVYGKDCKGNFQLLRRLEEKSPVFPAVNNQKSMIYVENLCAFLRLVIDGGHAGVFFPQNQTYVNTTDMAKFIAAALGVRTWFSLLAGLVVWCMLPFVPKAKKAFGSLIYEDCEQFDFCYCQESFESSIRSSV